MKRILTFVVAVLALSCLTPLAPAQAQAVFESVYMQPAQTVDGMNVGARIALRRGDSGAQMPGAGYLRPPSS